MTLSEFGKATVREGIAATGELNSACATAWTAHAEKPGRRAQDPIPSSRYSGGKLRTFELTPSGNVGTPYRFVLDIDKAGIGETTLATATVSLGWGSLWKMLPAGILADSDDEESDDKDDSDKDADKRLRKAALAVYTPFDSKTRLSHRAAGWLRGDPADPHARRPRLRVRLDARPRRPATRWSSSCACASRARR